MFHCTNSSPAEQGGLGMLFRSMRIAPLLWLTQTEITWFSPCARTAVAVPSSTRTPASPAILLHPMAPVSLIVPPSNSDFAGTAYFTSNVHTELNTFPL